MATQTQTQLTQLGYNEWKSIDTNAQPDIEGTDSYFKLNSNAAMITQSAQDAQLVENNIFPVSSTVPYIDKHAAELGMTPRMGALPTTGTVYLFGTPDATFMPVGNYVIPAETAMASSISGVSYYTLSDVILTNGVVYTFNSNGYLTYDIDDDTFLIEIDIQSVNTGTSTVTAPSTELTFGVALSIPTSGDPYSITDCAIPSTGLTPGSPIETTQLLAIRIYTWIQYPHGGGSDGDYYKWSFLGSSNVTGANIINTSNTASSILYPVILEGNADKNYYIDGDVYNGFIQSPNNRTTNTTDLAIIQTYINSQVPVNSSPLVISAATYYLINDNDGNDNLDMNLNQQIVIIAALVPGIELSTNITITNSDGTTQQITARNLIFRELRRGIVTTPFLGNKVYDNNTLLGYYILVSDLQRIILEGLESSTNFNGNYASILNGLTISYTKDGDESNYIELPDLLNNNKLVTDDLGYLVYDIDLNSTAIVVNTYTA